MSLIPHRQKPRTGKKKTQRKPTKHKHSFATITCSINRKYFYTRACFSADTEFSSIVSDVRLSGLVPLFFNFPDFLTSVFLSCVPLPDSANARLFRQRPMHQVAMAKTQHVPTRIPMIQTKVIMNAFPAFTENKQTHS